MVLILHKKKVSVRALRTSRKLKMSLNHKKLIHSFRNESLKYSTCKYRLQIDDDYSIFKAGNLIAKVCNLQSEKCHLEIATEDQYFQVRTPIHQLYKACFV